MSALLIDHSAWAALARLRLLASERPIDVLKLMEDIKTPDGKAAHKALVTEQTIELPTGFIVSFTIECGHPAGTCRHMTLSRGRTDRVPTIEAVRMVAAELGFVGGPTEWMLWPETLEGHGVGVNVIQPVAVVGSGKMPCQ